MSRFRKAKRDFLMTQPTNGSPDKLPEHGLVIRYDPASNNWGIAFLGQVPHVMLIGMLETAKAAVLGQQAAAQMRAMQQQAKNRIVMPDGSPPPG